MDEHCYWAVRFASNLIDITAINSYHVCLFDFQIDLNEWIFSVLRIFDSSLAMDLH